MRTNSIAAALRAVVLGPEITFENLLMVPLLDRRTAPSPPAVHSALQHAGEPLRIPDYVLLDEALGAGWVEITEISEQGSVPELRVVNRGTTPALIIDGEELVGAKQNRVVNLTILVAAQSGLTIPVSCVEAGRWRSRSRAFAAAPRAQYATGRAKRMAQVTTSMVMNESYHSNQAEVWSDIAAKCARLGAQSPTSAMEALYTDHSASIDRFVAACGAVEGQVGALFAVNGAIVGVDLFDRESTLRKMLPKLVRSIAIDAIDREKGDSHRFGSDAASAARKGDSPPFQPGASGDGAGGKRGTAPLSDAAARFLAAVSATPRHVAKALGRGDDVRLSGSGIVGAALVVDDAVVHLGAFNQPEV